MKPTLTICFLLWAVLLSAQNHVEFRGVERTGHYNEPGLLKQWQSVNTNPL